MDRKKLYIERTTEMTENEYSKRILIPIFSKIYKKGRVEFSGGVKEKGKDILIFAEDEMGFQQIIGVQVKKIEGSCNSKSKSFVQLMTQLSQMEAEDVVHPDTKAKHRLTKRYFVTPYIIDENHMSHSYGTFCKIKERGCEVLDGHKIYTLAERYSPELIDKVIGLEEVLWNEINRQISNIPLFNALNYKGNKKTEDIYCSVEFTLNHRDWEKHLLNRITPKSLYETIEISNESINRIKKTNEYCLREFGIKLYDIDNDISISILEEKHLKALAICKDDLTNISEEISKMMGNDMYHTYFSSLTINDIIGKLDSIQRGNSEIKGELATEVLNYGKVLTTSISRQRNLYERINSLESAISEQKYEISINTEALARHFEKEKLKLSKLLSTIFSPTEDYLRLLSKISVIMSFIDQNFDTYFTLTQYDSTSEDIISLAKINKNMKTPIINVFDSKYDIILLGGAGSGKTTNLVYYYISLRKREEKKFIYYSTLGEIAKKLQTRGENYNFEEAITKLLRDKNVDISIDDLVSKISTENTCFILDSIDEAAAVYPDILDSLVQFKNKYPKAQVITSSRYSVSDTMRLGFVAVNLLPFNHEQKEQFFHKWFDDIDKVNGLMKHLEQNQELNNIVNNPLSCTILAVLQQNSIPLPSTESSLYQKRFELMTGKLDQYKGVFRTTTQADELLSIATSLAYEMHKKKIRRISIIQAVKLLKKLEIHSTLDIDKAVSELVTPCEIFLVGDNGEYDFGHLKFQEYLSSIELAKDRTIVTHKILTDPWWHESIILYAQSAKSIDWLIQSAIECEVVLKCKDLLSRLIQISPASKREKLSKMVESSILSEIEDSEY